VNTFLRLDLRSTLAKEREDKEKAFAPVQSSRQQDSNQRHDNPPEETDQRIQNAQIKEPDDDKEPVRFQAEEEIRGSIP